jgi:ribose transport system ATP-binding protein
MTPLLQVSHISKGYPGVQALDDVSLHVNPGEVLAVIGENGAGKSTMMKILAGLVRQDTGTLQWNGSAVHVSSVRQATDLGISLIHQELNLADNLTVAQNVYLGREPNTLGIIHGRSIHDSTTPWLEKVGLKVAPTKNVHELTIGQQQQVEIAKALAAKAKLLIMDEPTSSLSSAETERLLALVGELSRQGVAVIYISHRLREVKAIAHRVVVLRDGKYAGEIPQDEISHDRMVSLMVGRDLDQFFARKHHTIGAARLEIDGMVTPAWPAENNTFSVRAGEIVGLAGLVGAGRTELLQSIFGVDAPLAGSIRVDGKPLRRGSVQAACRAGIALAPEDRKQHGLVLGGSVRENTLLAAWHNLTRYGVRRFAAETKAAADSAQQMNVKTPSLNQPVQFLSGGNQQKVVLGKWLLSDPKVLLLDEPTRGIDVGAKHEIYTLIEKLAEQGMAILMVSSEMEEVIGMSDRMLVMHEGKITGELARDEFTEETIMQLATGQATENQSAATK